MTKRRKKHTHHEGSLKNNNNNYNKKDTNRSSNTQTMASNNHGALAFIRSHSKLLTSMLHSNINSWSYGEKKKNRVGRRSVWCE